LDWSDLNDPPIGLFFFSSVQLIFIGIIGEYIGAIHTQVLKRPLVIEKEREKPGSGLALPLYLLFQIQSCFANLQEA
jgi:hypothetical protein